jgi:integrase
LVLQIIEPIWNQKPETASRIRGRIESVLDWATVAGYREGENPAVWRGRLVHLLPSKNKVRKVVHHPALPYTEMPAFFKSLAAETSDASRMLRWIILTAARYAEVKGMQPDEIEGDLWRIPAPRMKADRDHIVPLTEEALAQLPFRPVSDVTLATCITRHTESPATTHGMRSAFRDWAGDCTDHAREVAEAALAHAVGDETEAAYRRSTALAKRRKLMEDWAAYCEGRS